MHCQAIVPSGRARCASSTATVASEAPPARARIRAACSSGAGVEPQPGEWHSGPRGHRGGCLTVLVTSVDCIHDGRPPGRQYRSRPLPHRGIDPPIGPGGVRARWQPALHRHARELLADDIAADDHGSGSAAEHRRNASGSRRLARTGPAADGQQRRSRRRRQRNRQVEILACARPPPGLVVRMLPNRLGCRLRADRRAAREEQGKQPQSVELPFGLDVALEDGVGVRVQPAVEQVHQQEGQIVPDVDAGDSIVELDSVEQHRPSVQPHDVAKVEIAVAAAYPAADPARFEPGAVMLQLGGAPPGEIEGAWPVEDIRQGGELVFVTVDDPRHTGQAAFARGRLRGVVEGTNRLGQGAPSPRAARLRGRRVHRPAGDRRIAASPRASRPGGLDRRSPACHRPAASGARRADTGLQPCAG